MKSSENAINSLSNLKSELTTSQKTLLESFALNFRKYENQSETAILIRSSPAWNKSKSWATSKVNPPLIDSSTQLVNAIVEKEVRRINYDANRVNVANNIVPIVITILLLTMVIVSYRLSDRASEAIAAPIKKLLKENKDLADGNFTEIPAVGDD